MSDLSDLTRMVAEDEQRCLDLAAKHSLSVEQVRVAERVGIPLAVYVQIVERQRRENLA